MSPGDITVIIRGAGDLASGVAYALYNAGFKIIMTEISNPSAIRRSVSFCEAIYTNETTIEGITCKKASDYDDAKRIACFDIALLEDPNLSFLSTAQKPQILVDAIIAKKNLGTRIDMADFVVALGPGFSAGVDCHAVIETMRGHNLGRIIYEGGAIPNTGIPGLIGGVDKDRVIHSPQNGVISLVHDIGDVVNKGDVIAFIDPDNKNTPVIATIDGILRGIIRDGYNVKSGIKIADIDPRISEQKNCFTISDKSRTIGMATLLAIMNYLNKNFW